MLYSDECRRMVYDSLRKYTRQVTNPNNPWIGIGEAEWGLSLGYRANALFFWLGLVSRMVSRGLCLGTTSDDQRRKTEENILRSTKPPMRKEALRPEQRTSRMMWQRNAEFRIKSIWVPKISIPRRDPLSLKTKRTRVKL